MSDTLPPAPVWRPALVLVLAFTVMTGFLYPLTVTGISQALFPAQANGSLVAAGGRSVGSELIGQPFAGEGFFWSRPSATGRMPYDAAASTGSNLGPTNPALLARVRAEKARLEAAHPQAEGPPPLDLLTTSASGLDPHVSPAAAFWQVERVAAARGLPAATVRALVERHVEGRQLGLLGEPRVNVLALNLALERLAAENRP
ncbi:MAG TPA: potassium-transporting ATPase subunit KdpC [Thermoanaerobaculia bacterium]|nr:potassium-transporting ATPase subunit KdpC [Thermoanaerobaculia bacterium]